MITFSIPLSKKEVPALAGIKNLDNWPFTGQKKQEETQADEKAPWWSHVLARRMTKLEYAQYLSTLKIRTGDILIHANHVDSDGVIPNLKPTSFFSVRDISELHSHVEYERYEPRCLWVQDVENKHGGFWTAPSSWVVVDQSKMPPILNDYIKGLKHAGIANSIKVQ